MLQNSPLWTACFLRLIASLQSWNTTHKRFVRYSNFILSSADLCVLICCVVCELDCFCNKLFFYTEKAQLTTLLARRPAIISKMIVIIDEQSSLISWSSLILPSSFIFHFIKNENFHSISYAIFSQKFIVLLIAVYTATAEFVERPSFKNCSLRDLKDRLQKIPSPAVIYLPCCIFWRKMVGCRNFMVWPQVDIFLNLYTLWAFGQLASFNLSTGTEVPKWDSHSCTTKRL